MILDIFLYQVNSLHQYFMDIIHSLEVSITEVENCYISKMFFSMLLDFNPQNGVLFGHRYKSAHTHNIFNLLCHLVLEKSYIVFEGKNNYFLFYPFFCCRNLLQVSAFEHILTELQLYSMHYIRYF